MDISESAEIINLNLTLLRTKNIVSSFYPIRKANTYIVVSFYIKVRTSILETILKYLCRDGHSQLGPCLKICI